jgi:uridine kinase
MPYVIAVAAPIGGGKTAVAEAIAAKLPDATTISFDRYETATGQPVQNLREWQARGADFDEFVVPLLREDLERLRRGDAICDPVTKEQITAGKYVVFENPLGREAKSLAAYVDLLVWVEVPQEVALARKLKELVGGFLRQRRPDQHTQCLAWLDQYLENYLTIVRDVLQIQEKRVAAQADIVLPGLRSLDEIAGEAADQIRRRFP